MNVTKALAERFVLKFVLKSSSECWEWTGPKDADGFGILGYRNRIVFAHVISFSHFRYPPLRGMDIVHTCGNPGCVNPYHLKGKFKPHERSGEANCNGILTEKEVFRIRKRYECCQNVALVARAFGVPKSTVRDIVKRRTWKHV